MGALPRKRAKLAFVRQGSFRLLDLPAEIRNAVYFFIVDSADFAIDLRTIRSGPHPLYTRPDMGIKAFLHVNKQICAEFCPILYRNMTIEFRQPVHVFQGTGSIDCRHPAGEILQNHLSQLILPVIRCDLRSGLYYAEYHRERLAGQGLVHFVNLQRIEMCVIIFPNHADTPEKPALIQWLQDHWTEDENRCMNVGKRIKSVSVRDCPEHVYSCHGVVLVSELLVKALEQADFTNNATGYRDQTQDRQEWQSRWPARWHGSQQVTQQGQRMKESQCR